MSNNDINSLVSDYNQKLFNLVDFKKLEIQENEDFQTRANQFYNDNQLNVYRIKDLIKNENSEDQLWTSNIKNNLYYNVFNKNSNLYTLTFKSKFGFKKKIKITILPNGEIEYKELKKLEVFIGNPCIEKFTIEDLYCILYKLLMEGYIDVDLTQLRVAIKINRLNRELRETLDMQLNTNFVKKKKLA